MPKILASNLRDKEIVSETGRKLGYLYDLSVKEDTGEILSIVMEPRKDLDTSDMLTDKKGFVLIPFRAVSSVEELVVVVPDEIPSKPKESQGSGL